MEQKESGVTLEMKWRKGGKSLQDKKKNGRIGILTFHCADNYGALLQSYALRTWLENHSFEADIVPYAPFYMTSRHWMLPLRPCVNKKDFLRMLSGGIRTALRNFPILPDIIKQKKRMKSFRRKCLGLSGWQLRWGWQLKRLQYQIYIVGSDQIWNPSITYGLRNAYFGAFYGQHERVISYAASIGASEPPSEYQAEFSRLIKRVDFISVRERKSVPFVEKTSGRKVEVMPDPVLLLDVEQWKQAEPPCPLPDDSRYILFYAAGRNEEMIDYARMLSAQKGLNVIQLCYRRTGHIIDFSPIYSAGPGEFLTYIRRAEYVVANSFHGLAMSILYEKQFAAFLYTKRDERIMELLETTGLQGRLYGKENRYDIDEPIEWKTVVKNIMHTRKRSEQFLYNSLMQ